MSQVRFTEDHEWARQEADGSVTIGITEFAQESLGDLVYVELPAVGRNVTQGEAAAVVESVKAAADVKMPLSGEVLSVNETLADNPGLVNEAAESDGWILKLKPSKPDEFAALMDAAGYQAFTKK
ncbi:MAG: glycine cleavage system protein GcvH [Burkholderiaceae bacterium]|nr:MAG: glycine cleavage system protein GcvH [Burkholderiaceae bacterium]